MSLWKDKMLLFVLSEPELIAKLGALTNEAQIHKTTTAIDGLRCQASCPHITLEEFTKTLAGIKESFVTVPTEEVIEEIEVFDAAKRARGVEYGA